MRKEVISIAVTPNKDAVEAALQNGNYNSENSVVLLMPHGFEKGTSSTEEVLESHGIEYYTIPITAICSDVVRQIMYAHIPLTEKQVLELPKRIRRTIVEAVDNSFAESDVRGNAERDINDCIEKAIDRVVDIADRIDWDIISIDEYEKEIDLHFYGDLTVDDNNEDALNYEEYILAELTGMLPNWEIDYKWNVEIDDTREVYNGESVCELNRL